jgi:hypothetical protein
VKNCPFGVDVLLIDGRVECVAILPLWCGRIGVCLRRQLEEKRNNMSRTWRKNEKKKKTNN